MRLVGKVTGNVILSGGLAVIGSGTELTVGDSPPLTGPENGLTAASVRTGRAYWTYRRPAHGVRASSNGGRTDLLYALWDDGLLVRIDPRTGKVVWHHTAGKTLRGHALTGWPAIGPDTLTVGVTTPKSTGKAVTFDLRSGAQLWE